MNYDPLSSKLPRMLSSTRNFGGLFGGDAPQAQPVDLMKSLLQIYQGTAATAGPFAQLNAAVQPYEGQTALGLQQQQMFGYDSAGGSGSAATPYGGWVGQPYGGSGGTTGGTSETSIGGGSGLYSPPEGTRIGMGNTFNNPYAGNTPASQSDGYHPGVLGLNTTALADYGPAGTAGLLQANPFLANALSAQNQNISESMNSPLLDSLNSVAGNQLSSAYGNSPLNQAQMRNADQSSLSMLGDAGLVNGNTGIASQLFGRQAATEHQQQLAQTLASGVQQLNTAQQGLIGNLTSQAGSTATSGITSPLLGLLQLLQPNSTGDPSTSIANQTQLGAPAFGLGESVTGFNANAANAANIAGSNQSAAQNSAWIGLLGSLLGGGGYG